MTTDAELAATATRVDRGGGDVATEADLLGRAAGCVVTGLRGEPRYEGSGGLVAMIGGRAG
ncbi:hypothetical protein [Cryptosporangium japonicum]|uniref:Uncharacterized protein n=1 Tax=Cryptosporangium japonicum TaxID=80872 RepID=A0ABN0U1T2_9ACTN